MDERSRPTTGVTAASPCGVQVEAHRNWLQVRDQAAHRPGSGLAFPVVLTIAEGELTYLDVSVVAARGPRSGVYFVAWSSAGLLSHGEEAGMVGLACHGWLGGQYRGVLPDDVARLAALLADWSAAGRIPRFFSSVTFADALRFCQGDAFIAHGAGFPTPCTSPGAGQAEVLPIAYSRRPAQAEPKESST